MARARRCCPPGETFHVYNRGNNRTPIFRADRDYRSFLVMTRRAISQNAIVLHGFVLMANHFHLLVTPQAEGAVSLTMKEIAERYSRYFNDRYARTGALWEGRYHTRPMVDSADCLHCLRYIERNPVKAGLVASLDAYKWSSYGIHAFGYRPDWITPHASYLQLGGTARERQAAYRTLCGEPGEDELENGGGPDPIRWTG